MKAWNFLVALTGLAFTITAGCKTDPGSEIVGSSLNALLSFTNAIPTKTNQDKAVALMELVRDYYVSENRWPANADDLAKFAEGQNRGAVLRAYDSIRMASESNGDVRVFFRNNNGLDGRMTLSPPHKPSVSPPHKPSQ